MGKCKCACLSAPIQKADARAMIAPRHAIPFEAGMQGNGCSCTLMAFAIVSYSVLTCQERSCRPDIHPTLPSTHCSHGMARPQVSNEARNRKEDSYPFPLPFDRSFTAEIKRAFFTEPEVKKGQEKEDACPSRKYFPTFHKDGDTRHLLDRLNDAFPFCPHVEGTRIAKR